MCRRGAETVGGGGIVIPTIRAAFAPICTGIGNDLLPVGGARTLDGTAAAKVGIVH